MILNEFTTRGSTKLDKLTQALKENYDYNLNFDDMTADRAKLMAARAREMVEENKDINKRIKLSMIAESLDLWFEANIQTELTNMVAEGLDDDSMEEAKVILAAKELSDKIQGMIEDAAKMQVQDLIPIVDAMKSELGADEAEAYSDAADMALAGLVDALKNAKDQYDDAISAAQGHEPATDMDNFDMDGDDLEGGDMDDMGNEPDMDDMSDMSDMDSVDDDADDEFAGDDTAIGGDEPTGREIKDEI